MTNTVCPFCHVEHAVIVPTVHLNGTAAEDLHDQLQNALKALREAQRMLERASPNGRDYYPQGDSALVSALQSHDRRWMQLDRVLREIEEQRDHVQAVLDFKAEQRAARQEAR